MVSGYCCLVDAGMVKKLILIGQLLHYERIPWNNVCVWAGVWGLIGLKKLVLFVGHRLTKYKRRGMCIVIRSVAAMTGRRWKKRLFMTLPAKKEA